MLNRGKSVRNDKHRADVHHFFKRILNQLFGFGVYIRGRLVEYHDGGLVDYRPCEREQLPLTGGEIVAAFAHGFIQPAFKLVDKVIRVYVTAGLHDLLVGNSLFAQQNIAAYRAREKENVLKHLSEMPAQRCSLYLSDIDSVNQDFAGVMLLCGSEATRRMFL